MSCREESILRTAWRVSAALVLSMVLGSLGVLLLPGETSLGWPPPPHAERVPDWLAPWLFPLLGALTSLAMRWTPRFEPRRDNLLRSARAFAAGWMATIVMVTAVHFAILAGGVGIDVDVPRVAGVSVGAVLCVFGNYLGKSRSTFFAGVPTPWALSSERAWDESHRLGGRSCVALGLVTVLAAAFATRGVFATTLFGGLALVFGAVALRSHAVWRSEHRGESEASDGR